MATREPPPASLGFSAVPQAAASPLFPPKHDILPHRGRFGVRAALVGTRASSAPFGRVAAAHRTACSVSPQAATHEHAGRNTLRSDAARPHACECPRTHAGLAVGSETGLCVLSRVTKATGQSARAPAGATVRARRTQRAHGVKQHPGASPCAARLLAPVASGDAGADATKLSARRAATVATGRSIALPVGSDSNPSVCTPSRPRPEVFSRRRDPREAYALDGRSRSQTHDERARDGPNAAGKRIAVDERDGASGGRLSDDEPVFI